MSTENSLSTRAYGKKPSDSRFKVFLNDHCYIVDFFSASILICLCLIVLLPRVHESFSQPDAGHAHLDALASATLPPVDNQTTESGTTPIDSLLGPPIPDDDQHHHHHHHDGFPAGEFLVCVGFFVFYCAGLGMRPHPDKSGVPISSMVERAVMPVARRQSICCSSTRCPSSQPRSTNEQHQHQQQSLHAQTNLLGETTLILSPGALTEGSAEDGCVMLLNRHHQHHTHNRHHDHNHELASQPQRTDKRTYGATSRTAAGLAHPILPEGLNRRRATIVVDEIRIVSEPVERQVRMQWPRSLKMLVLSIILAVFLIFFDMNVLGMLRAIKVFRACSTGALLYVAFFIILPRDSAGCKPCEEEET